MPAMRRTALLTVDHLVVDGWEVHWNTPALQQDDGVLEGPEEPGYHGRFLAHVANVSHRYHHSLRVAGL